MAEYDKNLEYKTNLQRQRKLKHMTQAALSELSGVNYRTLQDYDQGHKDINKAQAITVHRLSTILECDMTDIMELQQPEGGEQQ